MKYKLTLALVAALTSTAFAAFQAPLPEFKNEKKLAEWRAEKASESTNQGYLAEESAFYTGKPYLASSATYAFRCRSYNSGLARWTSEDPSGFPDGANGSTYINNSPMHNLDYLGLSSLSVTIAIPWTSTLGFAQSAQWEGTYNWELKKNFESSSIDMNPGITGQLPIAFSTSGFNLGTTYEAVQLFHSTYEYRTNPFDGSSEKRYAVDLKVDIYARTTFGRHLAFEGAHLKLWNNWYE
jgi:RHS repeat-associated protein